MKHKTDEELFKLIQKGQRSAFEELYYRYRRPLIAYSLKKVDYEDAADLNQDLWINIWERRAFLQRKGPVVAYLFRAMRNRIIDYVVRSEHVETSLDTVEEILIQNNIDGTDFLISEKLFMKQIEGLLSRFNSRAEVIIRLRMQGYNNHEIARQLNLSEKTIRNLHSYILKYLRSKFPRLLGLLFIFLYAGVSF